ncbi:MAG: YHS domain-containing protein, partial [Chloroflexi bacterium]|nr:YHS domain-containing protein [Chloroflexota bacterium]
LAEIIQIRRQPSVSRLPLPTSDLQSPSEALDLVCGMMVEIATARYVSQHAGETYYFCSAGCKRSFEKEPETYLTRGA